MRKSRLGVLIAAIALLGSLMSLAPATPVAAASAFGCTFTVPQPSISSTGKASFTLRVTCSTSAVSIREVIVDLMGDDVAFDNVQKWAAFSATKATTYTRSFSGWPCNEDRPGGDEIYLRVRLKSNPFYVTQYSSWVKGPVRKGTCS